MKARRTAPSAGGTVERILDGALELFNRVGGAMVTTNHIAAHLGMSPGNLYYHFRNRWIAFLAALRPEREIDRADVAEGALHSFLVVEPHLEPRFAAAARKVIERHRRRARA